MSRIDSVKRMERKLRNQLAHQHYSLHAPCSLVFQAMPPTKTLRSFTSSAPLILLPLPLLGAVALLLPPSPPPPVDGGSAASTAVTAVVDAWWLAPFCCSETASVGAPPGDCVAWPSAPAASGASAAAWSATSPAAAAGRPAVAVDFCCTSAASASTVADSAATVASSSSTDTASTGAVSPASRFETAGRVSRWSHRCG